jgi:CoA-transferase family III
MATHSSFFKPDTQIVMYTNLYVKMGCFEVRLACVFFFRAIAFHDGGAVYRCCTPTAARFSIAVVKTVAKPVLCGLRILEIGHFVAAPFCARLLGDLGADVVKIEPLAGDPVRGWGAQRDGQSLWWSMHGRNKRSVAMNLKSPAARELVLRLVAKFDAVVENFRPGQLARMGLGPEQLRAVRPDLVTRTFQASVRMARTRIARRLV